MSNITVNIFNYNGTENISSIVGVLISIGIPLIVLFVKSFVIPHCLDSANFKNTKNIIAKNVYAFRKINTIFNNFQNMALYHNGMVYNRWKDLMPFGIIVLSFFCYIGLLYFEASLASSLKLLFGKPSNPTDLFGYLLFWFLIILLGIAYIKYRRDIIFLFIFSSSLYQFYQHQLGFKYNLIKTSELINGFKKVRKYSYLLILLNTLAFGQVLINIVWLNTSLSTAKKNELFTMLTYVVLFTLAVILWMIILININKITHYYIKLNLLTTMFELGKLPYITLGLSNGNVVSGLVFDIFTNKKYLTLLNNANDKIIKEVIFIPQKSIDWIKFEY